MKENQKQRFSIKMTPTAKQGLEDLADSLGLSMAELVERIGRGKLRVESIEDSMA
jgi:predicted DNA-binding protein